MKINIAKISACIIAKDAEKDIIGCLDSIKDFCFEVIIVLDTRTTDNTAKLLEAWADTHNHIKVKIIPFNWLDETLPEIDFDSFAAARNEALKYAAGEWILCIDCDERLTNHQLPEADFDYYLLTARNFKNGLVNSDYWTPRLFKNNIGIHFRWATHEENWHCLKDKKGKFSEMVFEHKEKTIADATNKNHWLLSRGMRQLTTEPHNPYVRGQISHSQLIIGNLQQAVYYGTEAMVQGAEPEVKALLCVHLYRAFRMMRDAAQDPKEANEYWHHAIFWLKYSIAMCPQQLSANALFYDFYKEENNTEAMNYHKSLLEKTGNNSMLPYDIKYENINW